ncbi:MAG TPA: chromosome segregation protein SMC [Acidimicrobiales bacterium]|nr:chromosome segregation protein SMC [Acidimicrobiales bacterium]
MFLKSLTLKGFKSFADTTTLEFEPGVTVVVGPNGSGKSNIVDAVAWVLGAQGPRTVRSAKMEDVIFAGTPKRGALGRAEVSLTIDNSAGILPIEFSEVTVTRTLFRTGDSEYAINGVPCRLLDVTELLSDSGVGRQQHVIVSQGNLDSVLNARPEERRLIIEEAAGILKYRRRKEKSERRLESTEASVTRLQDLLREVRRQLRPLERQAGAARRHGDLVAELTAVRRFLAGRELATIEGRLVSAAQSRAELGHAEGELRDLLSRLDADVASAEVALSGVKQRDDQADLGEALSGGERVRARAGGLVALLSERRRSIARDRAVTIDQDVVSSLEGESADLHAQLEASDRDVASLLPQSEELADAEATLADEIEELDRRWTHDVGREADPLAEVRQELGALRAVVERDASEVRRLEARAHSVLPRAARLDADGQRLRQVVDDCERSTAPLIAALAAATEVLGRCEADQAEADEAHRREDRDHHRWSARAEALGQALDEARARAGAERLGAVDGVVGTLLELVEVDAGFETAFEVAAGEAIAAVVVGGVGAARRALDHLAAVGSGGAVVALPDRPGIDAEAPASSAGEAGSSAGVMPSRRGSAVATLRGHVRAVLPAVNTLLDGLLAGAVVVDGGWAEAVDLALEHPELTVVTRGGDRCAGGVWRTGASTSGATGAALEEARSHADRHGAAARSRRAELDAANQALGAARAGRAEAAQAVDANDAQRRAALDAAARCELQLQEARSDAEAAVTQHRETRARLEREQQRMKELEEGVPALERQAAVQSQHALAERAARARVGERVAAVGALRRDLEVRAAGIEERRGMLTRRLAEIDARLRRNVAERDEAAARRELLERQDVATGRLLGSVTARMDAVERVVDVLRTTRRQEAEATRALTERLEQLRRQRVAAERHLSELRERVGRAELDEAEARVRLESLTDMVRRELDCEPEATREAQCPPMPPGTSPANRARELERELRLLGPVNPLALEEHEALEQRHEFLQAQLDDVRAARRELGKVIRAIEAEIVEVFSAAWADVSENFEALFATLFPGGQGRLRLTDPDRLLDTGIEVDARPSGKNVRRLSLLSGGERSLTAMAFLFAVFRSRPSPFYLMDEVEAALDDVNLHRFLDLVHEFRQEAQLLVVSHQKRTMEAADCLYGVTMSPGGSSRVVSERVTAPS